MELISVEEVMEYEHLGPNGGLLAVNMIAIDTALLYCMEYLEKNTHWLLDVLSLLKGHTFNYL